MPSQEDYLDNLLKGIGNTEEEENSRKESEEGVKDETLQDPQIDMSDMDDKRNGNRFCTFYNNISQRNFIPALCW